MAINVSQAFHRTSANPVDESMALTKAQMLTVNDNLMPAYYFTICQDDGEIYLYDKTATASAETGKFKKFEGGGGGGGTGSGVVITKTLLASGWDANNRQTLTFTDYETDMGGVIGMPTNATAAQKEAYAASVINVYSQSGNQFTFECEEKPSIDLPVTLYAGGAGGSGSGVPAGGTTGQVLAKKSNTDGDVEWKDVANPTQVSTMPAASAANVGQIVQFVGTTDANYTNGLFYECVSDGQSTPTYSWEQKDVQSYPETDLTNVFSSGFPTASVTGPRPFSYSTDEQVVGTWIDGKPIYQKTISINSYTKNAFTKIDIDSLNIDLMINYSGIALLNRSNVIAVQESGMIADDAEAGRMGFFITFYNKDSETSNRNKLVYRVNYVEQTTPLQMYITLQYTKTTD